MNPAKYKILIVDDEPELLDLTADILSGDYDTIQAGTGEEALELIEKNAADLACVVSDFKMPGITGMELREKMLVKYKDIPFVMVSGFVTREDALAAINLKISAFEAKPVDNAKLLATIKRVSADREGQILERITLEQIFIEEATNITIDLEPLIMSLEQNPSDLDAINTIFRLVHTIKGSSGVLESNHIRGYVHKFEDLLSKIKNGLMAATPEVVSVLLQGFDVVNQMIAGLRTGTPWEQDVDQLAVIFNIGNTPQAQTGPQVQKAVAVGEAKAQVAKDTVNVPAALLDEFMELSGEITVIRNMVNKLVRVIEKEMPGNRNVQHLVELLDEMHKINSGMQGRLVETRKLSLTKVFRPLPRAVRDTAKLINKQVNLRIEGDTTRVDTSLAQVLSDSLIHIVRNSIDHGIEGKEKRLERRKSPDGNITIRANEQGEAVVISIQDDGGGLDTTRIKKKAVERGLYSADEVEKLSEQKIFSLIFESGFSTAAQVTDVSGRGVGMDMVRSSVEKVKGHIGIDSELGKGTKFKS